MTQRLQYGADQLKPTDGQWQLWQFSSRSFLNQNKIDLTPYIDGTNWEFSAVNILPRPTPPLLYRHLDGTVQIEATAIWQSPDQNPTVPVVVINLSQVPSIDDIFKELSTANMFGTAYLENVPGAAVLGCSISYNAAGTPQALNVWNTPASDVTFRTGNQFYFSIKVYPTFADN